MDQESSLIRAVVWDFGGVLVRTEDPSPRRAVERRLGLHPGGLEALVFRSEVGRETALGERTEAELWSWVMGQVGLPPDERPTIEAAFFAGDRLDAQLVAYIRRLRPRYLTGLLSNAFLSLRSALKDPFPIGDAFDAIVISAEVGVLKPDPAIYIRILETLGVEPNHAVFIDDFEENCEGARRLGMHALRFESTVQTIDALDSLLRRESPG
jgi:FMN phosphatase YigB (HAD superfamily)